MKYLVVLALALVACEAARLRKSNLKSFSYENCNTADPIQLNSMSITPDPVVIPGEVTVSLDIQGTVGVSSPTPGDFTFQYSADGGSTYVDLPCVGNIGSCHYDDVCVILSTVFADGCPDAFTASNVPCNCPFEANVEYNLQNLVLDFVEPLETLQAGDYKLRLRLGTDDNELACYDYTITLVGA